MSDYLIVAILAFFAPSLAQIIGALMNRKSRKELLEDLSISLKKLKRKKNGESKKVNVSQERRKLEFTLKYCSSSLFVVLGTLMYLAFVNVELFPDVLFKNGIKLSGPLIGLSLGIVNSNILRIGVGALTSFTKIIKNSSENGSN